MKAGNKTLGPRLRDISDTNVVTGPGQGERLQAIAATGSISKPEAGAGITGQLYEKPNRHGIRTARSLTIAPYPPIHKVLMPFMLFVKFPLGSQG